MTYTRLVAAAAAVGVLVLGACTGGPTTEDRSVAPSTPTETSSVAAAPRVAMTESHRYADGVTVGVKGYTDLTMNAANVIEGAEEGDPYVIITLLWANKGASKVDLTPLIVVRSGSAATEAPRVHNDESREFITLDPGDSTEYDVGVVVPAAEQNAVTMEITDPADPSRAVTFAGAIG